MQWFFLQWFFHSLMMAIKRESLKLTWKNRRIHEFYKVLKSPKKGLDNIMSYRSITSILTPSELKLFICRGSDCFVEQMKQLTKVESPDERMTECFCWRKISFHQILNKVAAIASTWNEMGNRLESVNWNKKKIFWKIERNCQNCTLVSLKLTFLTSKVKKN